jgi:hypothetical protein
MARPKKSGCMPVFLLGGIAFAGVIGKTEG